MSRILNAFRLFSDKEKHLTVIQNIENGVAFRGTNLWILIFAIFVASIGLNVNSTAVIIGAMLISPLMGPIMGLGLGIGTNDLALIRKSFSSYSFAAATGLATSTLYFVVSPLNEAHSEILARVQPNIYDVLVAMFSGFAGIIATSSKQKGNVLPGVAIATALMPPLCTAGYGLATWHFSFVFGALYLFVINTVFIALATLVVVRLLKFPYKHLPDEKAEQRSKRMVWLVVLATVLPSLYFGYDIVQQNRFEQNANLFIKKEGVFPNDYLLNKTVDARNRQIVLTYGGQKIEQEAIDALNLKLPYYHLEDAVIQVKQGFAYLDERQKEAEMPSSREAYFQAQTQQLEHWQAQQDSIEAQVTLQQQIFVEMKALFPNVQKALLIPQAHMLVASQTPPSTEPFIYIQINKPFSKVQKKQLETWLQTRLKQEKINLVIQ